LAELFLVLVDEVENRPETKKQQNGFVSHRPFPQGKKE